jgi:competence protein ComEC
VVPAGYRNRFGHPNPDVLERYRSAGITVFRTDQDAPADQAVGGACRAYRME